MDRTIDAELATLNSDIFRKIGRNLVMVQYVEGLLKELVTTQHVSGSLSTLVATQEQRRAKIRKQTLGQLLHHYLDLPPTHADMLDQEPTDVTEPWLAINGMIWFIICWRDGSQICSKVARRLPHIVTNNTRISWV